MTGRGSGTAEPVPSAEAVVTRLGSGGPWERVAGLLHPDHLVEVEVEAYLGGERLPAG